MRARNLISLGNLGLFAALLGTGVVMFISPHDDWTAALHCSLALVFVVLIALHLAVNGRALVRYLGSRHASGVRAAKPARAQPGARVSNELIVSVVILLVLGVLGYVRAQPIWALYGWGLHLRHAAHGLSVTDEGRQKVSLQAEREGVRLEVVGDKGEAFEWPVFAVWAEHGDGANFQTLYISRLIGTSKDSEGQVVRRPQALPVWAHRYGHIDDDGFYLPEVEDPDLDAVSGATPTDGFALRSSFATSERYFDLYLELNQSFDWNAYFPDRGTAKDDRFDGGPGQPSVVYRARIDRQAEQTSWPMELVGFGHPDGRRGSIYTDLRRITTARNIVVGPRVDLLPDPSK